MEGKNFTKIVREIMDDKLRKENDVLYFIEFPDESWLMENRINKTKSPQFAMPFADKKIATGFMKHYKLDKEFNCKITPHTF